MTGFHDWLIELVDKAAIKAGAWSSVVGVSWSLLGDIPWLTVLSATVAVLTCISLLVKIWSDLARHAREKHVFDKTHGVEDKR